MRERDKPLRSAGGRRAPPKERRALLAAGCALAAAVLWAALWWNSPVYPITIEQAASWHARSLAAAAEASAAPRSALTVELVVSRFSGNLSWVPALAELMHVTNVTVYCKVRRPRAHVLCRSEAGHRTRTRQRPRCRARTRCPT